MEGVRSSRRPVQDHSGGSPRDYESMSSQENLSLGEKGDNWRPSERQTRKITGMGKGSQQKGASTRQSQRPRSSRPHRRGSPDGPLSGHHKENEHPEEKVRGRPSPTPGRRKDQSDVTGAGHLDRRGLAHPPLRLNGRRTRPRSPAKTTGPGRCQEDPGGRPASPKRRRPCRLRPYRPSAQASAPLEPLEPLDVLMPRLFNQVGALQVALDELRAPGGAFLPVPSGGLQPETQEPEARHRAWLSWQLAHTGANLHWALCALDTLLAAQPGLPAQPPCPPRAPQP